MRSLCLVGFALISLIALISASNGPLLGGESELSGDSLKEATQFLDITLAKLSEGDGYNLKVVRVISATRQVVSGSLYRYQVEVPNGDATKQCTVKIWSQPWLLKNGTNIKVKCEGDSDELDRTW